eukprot:COSAG01_NODE_4365_length_5094_cov_1.949750_3_plen_71_part_00
MPLAHVGTWCAMFTEAMMASSRVNSAGSLAITAAKAVSSAMNMRKHSGTPPTSFRLTSAETATTSVVTIS